MYGCSGRIRGTEEAVAWEDLSSNHYALPHGTDASLRLYRKPCSDLQRHAEAEATLHCETYALRHATNDYDYAPEGPEGDSSLILSAPHSMQPVVLEDNQATIRIVESGKSPASGPTIRHRGSNEVGYPNSSEESTMC